MTAVRTNTLLVEDDRAHARIVQHALRKTRPDFTVHHVWDGDEALNFVYGRGVYADRSTYPLPDLILLDLRMPRVDGFDVLRQLKTDSDTRAIPIVVMTSSDRPCDIERCMQSGADVFMTKPIDFPRLLRQLEDGLGSERASRTAPAGAEPALAQA